MKPKPIEEALRPPRAEPATEKAVKDVKRASWVYAELRSTVEAMAKQARLAP